ncbi:MAG: hypothetical protein K6F57_01725 [Candidatus Saccharibacteria bacterium]|nr:hypothetical protein [Candidatus Saccharibacteria bacterium]
MSKQTVKKIIAAALIVVGFVLLKFVASFALNESLVANIDNGDYSDGLVKALYALNLEEPYVVHYNDGIRYYELADFKNSQAKFEEALNHNPPEDRICDVRVNLSLSMLKQIKKDDLNAGSKLQKAKEVLYENDCARESDDNGKSNEAEKLEHEIENLQKEQEDSSSDPNSDPSQDPNSNPDDPTVDIDIENIEEQLKNEKIDALKGRQQQLGEYREMGGDYYSGRSW